MTRWIFLLLVLVVGSQLHAQQEGTIFDTTKPRIRVDSLSRIDSPRVANKNSVDSVMLRYSPRKAAIRSAILPGWGQIYNKRYWKLPLVYGALGVTAGIFIYNLSNYKKLKYAYLARYNASIGDTSMLPGIDPKLRDLDASALQAYRNEFRRNVDYSALFFIIFWGLNVVDAAVDAHLKPFDVSPDLSLKFRFGNSPMAGTNGISLILAFK